MVHTLLDNLRVGGEAISGTTELWEPFHEKASSDTSDDGCSLSEAIGRSHARAGGVVDSVGDRSGDTDGADLAEAFAKKV
jgi:hypothetical protein